MAQGTISLLQAGVAAGRIEHRGTHAALQRALAIQMPRFDRKFESAGTRPDIDKLNTERFEQGVVEKERVHMDTLIWFSEITRCQRASSWLI